jgi:hypothetical protein
MRLVYTWIHISPMLKELVQQGLSNCKTGEKGKKWYFLEAFNKQIEPIPGLYAAGVVTSRWQSNIYCGALSAGAFGYAVNSGRIAGENSTH